MNNVVVDFIFEKKKKRIDRLLNLVGIIFLLLSIIGLGSKGGGIPSFSIVFGSYVGFIIIVLILIFLNIILFRKILYKKDGEIVFAKDYFALREKKKEQLFLFDDLIDFKISINDNEGFDNFIEFMTDNSCKVFFAFKREEDYFQTKDLIYRKTK